MRIKASKHGDLIILRFSKVKDLRFSTFRFLYYPRNDIFSFTENIKHDDTKASYSSSSYFSAFGLPIDATKEEEKVHRIIKELTGSRYSRYSVIVYPEYEKVVALDHELCHYFYNKYLMYRLKARYILRKFHKLECIKTGIKKEGYSNRALTEEIIAYCSSEPNSKKIRYKNKNKKFIADLGQLFRDYKEKYFDNK
jgi:hypothetical protein